MRHSWVSVTPRLGRVPGRPCDDLGGHLVEVDRPRRARKATIGLGEHEQRLDQPLGAAVLLEQLRPDRSDLRGVGVVVQADLHRRALHRQGRPEFVGRLGDEPALALERGLQAGQQVVDGAREPPELVVGTVQRDALVQVRRRDAVRGRGDPVDGPEDPAADEPADAPGRDPGTRDPDRGPLPLLHGHEPDHRHRTVVVGSVDLDRRRSGRGTRRSGRRALHGRGVEACTDTGQRHGVREQDDPGRERHGRERERQGRPGPDAPAPGPPAHSA
ncbi:hypothetical protein WDV91_02780 [Curtobacterium flaccumfaciens pv. flaccumfaciens]